MRTALRILVNAVLLLVASVALWALAQTSDYFQNYPGGLTQASYQITTEQLESPIWLRFQVEPAPNNRLTVITTNQVTARREELEIGVSNGVAQAQLITQDEAIRSLLENKRNLQPQTTYILPGGAHFRSVERETIAGVSVLCGLLTKPDKPNQRTVLAISEEPTLPFPPAIQQEEQRSSGGTASSLSFCESLRPLLNSAGRRYVTLFQLMLTEFEHRE
jgi:hypothetical protein